MIVVAVWWWWWWWWWLSFNSWLDLGCFVLGLDFGMMKKRQRHREKRQGRGEREGSFIFILLGSLYYFISMYVKIEIGMLREL